jgi:putative addiction module component (TIGR02574 family)
MATADVDRILDEALRLTPPERAQLLARLIESLEDDEAPIAAEEWEQAWAEEIRRRIADLEAGRSRTIPWEDVRSELFDESDEP